MEQLAIWRNISIVFLAVQCMVGVILMLALSYVLVRLMNTLQGKAEQGVPKVQQLTAQVAEKTSHYAAKATAPVIKAQRAATRASATVDRLLFGKRDPRSKRAAPPPGTIQQ